MVLLVTFLCFILDINQPPVANAGPDVIVHLPNRAAELDGSKSIDDHGITKYIWRRDPKSPAAGVCNSPYICWNRSRGGLLGRILKSNHI